MTPILRKDLVQEVYDDIARGWLRTLRFPVVYHRRGKNHESSALICPPDCTSLLGGESICVAWKLQEEIATPAAQHTLSFWEQVNWKLRPRNGVNGKRRRTALISFSSFGVTVMGPGLGGTLPSSPRRNSRMSKLSFRFASVMPWQTGDIAYTYWLLRFEPCNGFLFLSRHVHEILAEFRDLLCCNELTAWITC